MRPLVDYTLYPRDKKGRKGEVGVTASLPTMPRTTAVNNMKTKSAHTFIVRIALSKMKVWLLRSLHGYEVGYPFFFLSSTTVHDTADSCAQFPCTNNVNVPPSIETSEILIFIFFFAWFLQDAYSRTKSLLFFCCCWNKHHDSGEVSSNEPLSQSVLWNVSMT